MHQTHQKPLVMDQVKSIGRFLLLLASAMTLGYLSSGFLLNYLYTLLDRIYDLIAIPAIHMLLVRINSLLFVLASLDLAFQVGLFWYYLLFCREQDGESVNPEVGVLSEQQLLALSWSMHNSKSIEDSYAWRVSLPAPTDEEIDALADRTIIATTLTNSRATNTTAKTRSLGITNAKDTRQTLKVGDLAPPAIGYSGRKPSIASACPESQHQNDSRDHDEGNEDEEENRKDEKRDVEANALEHVEIHSLHDVYQELFGRNRLRPKKLIWYAADIGSEETGQLLNDSALDTIVKNAQQQLRRGARSVQELIMEAYIIGRGDSRGNDAVWGEYYKGAFTLTLKEANRLARIFVRRQSRNSRDILPQPSQSTPNKDAQFRTPQGQRSSTPRYDDDLLGDREEHLPSMAEESTQSESVIDVSQIHDMKTLWKTYRKSGGNLQDEDAVLRACELGDLHRKQPLEKDRLKKIVAHFQQQLEGSHSMEALFDFAYKYVRQVENGKTTKSPTKEETKAWRTSFTKGFYFDSGGVFDLESIDDLPTLLKKYDEGGFSDKQVIRHACKLGGLHGKAGRMDKDKLDLLLHTILQMRGGMKSMPELINMAYKSAQVGGPDEKAARHFREERNRRAHNPGGGEDEGEDEENIDKASTTNDDEFKVVPEQIDNIPFLWQQYQHAPHTYHRKQAIRRACQLGDLDRGYNRLHPKYLNHLIENIQQKLSNQDWPMLTLINYAYDSICYHGISTPPSKPTVDIPPEIGLNGQKPTTTLDWCLIIFRNRVSRIAHQNRQPWIHHHEELAELWRENLALLRVEYEANFVAEEVCEDGSRKTVATKKEWASKDLMDGVLWPPGCEEYVYPDDHFEED